MVKGDHKRPTRSLCVELMAELGETSGEVRRKLLAELDKTCGEATSQPFAQLRRASSEVKFLQS